MQYTNRMIAMPHISQGAIKHSHHKCTERNFNVFSLYPACSILNIIYPSTNIKSNIIC